MEERGERRRVGERAPIAAASSVFESRAPYELAYWTKLGLV